MSSPVPTAATPLAITGLGCLGAPGVGLDAQLPALRAGRCGLRTAPLAGVPLAAHMPMGVVTEALPPGLFRNAALALSAGAEALTMAGLDAAQRRECGVIVGTSTGGMLESEGVYLYDQQVASPIYRNQQAHRVARVVARRLGLRGPQSTHSVACVSAACALAEAAMWLRSGLLEACLVIGSDCHVRITSAGFTSLQLIDKEGCRPFTEERRGMSLGEGAGALLLETPDHARRRQAAVIASLRGWGLRGDGYHPTSPDPEATQLRRAIQDALSDAGCSADAIDWVNAHGTGTRDNDATECKAFAHALPGVPVSSLKRVYGHTMGAAAAIEAVACCLAIHYQERYPSAGCDLATPMAGCPLQKAHQHTAIEAVCSTSLAFGGMDAALIFGRAEACA